MRIRDTCAVHLSLLGILFFCTVQAYSLPPGHAELRDGTPVILKLTTTISTLASHAGDPVKFEAIQRVRVGGEVVIPKGSVAMGHVAEVQRKHFLHGGSLVIAIDQITLADGEKVPLRAYPKQRLNSKGKDISKQIDFSSGRPSSLYKPGNAVGKGIEITAYVDADTPLDLALFKHSPVPAAALPAKIHQLKLEALNTDDPAQQVKIYDRILQLDPGDQEAYQRRQDAQEKLKQVNAQQEQHQQEEEARQQQETQQRQRDVTKRQALARAEDLFLVGRFGEAATQIAIAKKIAPSDPAVERLDELIRRQRERRQYLKYLFAGLGLLVLVILILALRLSHRKVEPYLEIVSGEGAGKRFRLDQDIVHLGAVAEDGGRKNEIVITDVDHTISRFHCEVHRKEGKYYVLDCDSANGTFVNTKRVRPGHPQRLKKGYRLNLAATSNLRLIFMKKRKE